MQFVKSNSYCALNRD